MELRIKIFKDGSKKLQFLVARCGENKFWRNIPVVFEEETTEEDLVDEYRLYPEFQSFFEKEVFTGDKLSYFKAWIAGRKGN